MWNNDKNKTNRDEVYIALKKRPLSNSLGRKVKSVESAFIMEESQLHAVIQDLVDRIRDAGHTLVVFDQEDVIPGEVIGGRCYSLGEHWSRIVLGIDERFK